MMTWRWERCRAGDRPTTMPKITLIAIIAALTELTVSGCATASPSAPTTGPSRVESGVAGMTVTTRCPVVTPSGCPPVPVAAHVSLVDAQGTTVRTVDSGTDGRFVLAADPGAYTVTAAPISGPLPRPASVTVTVGPGSVAQVTIEMDSGIR